MKPLEWIAGHCERSPRLVLGVVLLLTFLLGIGIPRITTETDQKKFLSMENESVKATFELMDKFGGTTYEQILVEGKDLTTLESLKAIISVKTALLENKELQGYIVDVSTFLDPIISQGLLNYRNSASTAELLTTQDEGKVRQVLTNDAQSPHPQIIGLLLSPNYRAAQIRVLVSPILKQDEASAKTRIFEEAVKNYAARFSNLKFSITGEYSISNDMLRSMGKDNLILIPAAMLLVVLVLYLTYRRITDVFLPFLTIGIAVIWILGIMGYVGITFTTIHVAIAPLLLGISMAYTIHMLSRYYEERKRGALSAVAVTTGIHNVGTSIFLAAITTVFGFISFGISPLPPLRDFGLIAGLGIVISFLLTVSLLPALLVLRDKNKPLTAHNLNKETENKPAGKSLIDQILSGAFIATLHHRKIIMAVTILLTGASLWAATGVTTTTSFENMISQDTESMKTQTRLKELFGGAGTANALVIIAKGDLLKPESIQEILSLEQRLRAISEKNSKGERYVETTSVMSIADQIVMANGGAIPQSQTQSETILSAMKQRSPSNTLAMLIDKDGRTAPIFINVNVYNDSDMKEVTQKVRETIKNSPTTLNYMVGGMPAIMADILGGLVSTQVKSSLLALILAVLVVSLLFKSVSLGLLSLIPVGLSLIWEFGFLRLFGWPLDMVTIMVSALVVGMGIDFSIHVLNRFREEQQKGISGEETVKVIIHNVGRPIISAGFSTFGVFAVLGISRMPVMRRFGMVTAVVILSAMLAALLILPLILVNVARRNQSKKLARGN